MRSRPGPEATVQYLTVQLGMCWAEIGPHYDSFNESVIPAVKTPRQPKSAGKSHRLKHVSLTSSTLEPQKIPAHSPLAGAAVQRNHECPMTRAEDIGGAAC